MKFILFTTALLALTACSNREVYDSLQGARQQECGKIIDDSARQRCFSEAGKSHDRYEKERQQ
jgi:hypothetical protein